MEVEAREVVISDLALKSLEQIMSMVSKHLHTMLQAYL